MVGARAREVYAEQAKERQREAVVKGNKTRHGKESPVPVASPELARGETRELLGKAVGVGGRIIDKATRVLRDGTPELVEAVDQGRVTVEVAARIAEEPHERAVATGKAPKRNHFRRRHRK
jgi:hypothetical protein